MIRSKALELNLTATRDGEKHWRLRFVNTQTHNANMVGIEFLFGENEYPAHITVLTTEERQEIAEMLLDVASLNGNT